MSQSLLEHSGFGPAAIRNGGYDLPPAVHPTRRSLRRHLLAGFIVAAVLIGGVGGWSAIASISSAVIASGKVVVESNTKLVQHAEGGIVGEIAVRDGDRVKAGDLLVRLDGTATKANLAIITKQMTELETRRTRLIAERDKNEELVFPVHLQEQAKANSDFDLLEGERKLFQARWATLSGQREQLQERMTQTRDEIAGLTSQRSAKSREVELTEKELELIRGLKEKKLIPITQYMALERESVKVQGEHGQLIAEIARAEGRVSETQLQVLQLDKEFREAVLGELRDAEAKLAELAERRVAALDQLRRLEIQAPQSGMVHQLAIHTRGGVITPGQALMQIVPQDDKLIVEARVAPGDIDQIQKGQDAVIHFTAFNQRTTPQLNATLFSVAADLTEDERSGEQYFLARLRLSEEELLRLRALTLTPGMPAEVFIQTGARSALSYLVKPFEDQISRAFREE
ncbi:HlyD family type I secretion periplasmic adaptor subunit [Pelagibius sp. Alg239-R121]|uniref:HlyD family type I secretion periplasmic adaptor subunit n=1 Tax=Pelagibius sp. Alg239-R121 TaxID=2993448 RepID=UPI0024A6FFA1|nr:HlyD family type I secretion periplasmic adaptor subunit [Pelagibius sp. Alg239-R121]